MSLVEKALNKMKEAERQSARRVAQLAAAEPPSAAATDEPVPAPAVAVLQPAPVTTMEPPPSPASNDAVTVVPAAPLARLLKIDPDTLRAAGYMPPPQQEREMIEQFRHIKRPLVGRAKERAAHAQGGPPMRVIMVTSALPKEGKTFTAINLTRSFALEKDASILLIDADVANPQTSRILGALGRAGLTDALADPDVDVETLVHQTNVPGLQVLPVGSPTEFAVELLGGRRMPELIERLLHAVPDRIILIDSAPLLITNEGKALIPVAGQVALVVRANSTPQHAVVEAADLFNEDQYVGVVLNQCEEAVGLGYGYYGGTYNYGGSYGYGGYGRRNDGSPESD